MIRSDERLDDLPMTPVECQRCRATVRVRKSSWQQTSVQWDEAGTRACPERRSPADAGGPVREADFFTCAGLRESIAQATLSGAIPMPEGSVAYGGTAGAAAEERAVRQ
ncbi:ferredoxin [Actinomadura sp. DC4]|uniref:ferredoxin n=1 Tax=Actinomadura sp. DC4 TaxID=3055069 RepID=UPI0025B022E0|nr:ferredoxin [Actinomadura sp. DC4]MDN3359034.1 ferredoxin [Actinomadura sp. DC4]